MRIAAGLKSSGQVQDESRILDTSWMKIPSSFSTELGRRSTKQPSNLLRRKPGLGSGSDDKVFFSMTMKIMDFENTSQSSVTLVQIFLITGSLTSLGQCSMLRGLSWS